jgi:hypothetical protein
MTKWSEPGLMWRRVVPRAHENMTVRGSGTGNSKLCGDYKGRSGLYPERPFFLIRNMVPH